MMYTAKIDEHIVMDESLFKGNAEKTKAGNGVLINVMPIEGRGLAVYGSTGICQAENDARVFGELSEVHELLIE